MDCSIQTEEYYTEYNSTLPSLKKPYHFVSVIDYSMETKCVFPLRTFKNTFQNSLHRPRHFCKKVQKRLGSAGPVLPNLKNLPGRIEAKSSVINLERLSVVLSLSSPKSRLKKIY